MRIALQILLVIGIILLISLVNFIGINSFIEGLKDANYLNLIISIAVYVLVLITGLVRWMFLIQCHSEEIELKSVSEVYFTNTFTSNLTPGRSGDVIAPILLNKHCGLSLKNSVSIIVLDRATDIFWLLSFSIFSFIYVLASTTSDTRNITQLAENASLLVITLIIAIALFHRLLSKMAGFSRYLNKVSEFIKLVSDELKNIRIKQIAILNLLALCTWALQFTKNLFLITTFTTIDFTQNVVCQSLSSLAGLISFIPGGIGVDSASYTYIASLLGLDWQNIIIATVSGTVLFNLIRLTGALTVTMLHGKHS